MPLYYFDIRDENGLNTDEEGSDLANLQAAQQEAVMSIADMSRSHRTMDAPHRISVEVKDDRKRPLLIATLILEVKASSP